MAEETSPSKPAPQEEAAAPAAAAGDGGSTENASSASAARLETGNGDNDGNGNASGGDAPSLPPVEAGAGDSAADAAAPAAAAGAAAAAGGADSAADVNNHAPPEETALSNNITNYFTILATTLQQRQNNDNNGGGGSGIRLVNLLLEGVSLIASAAANDGRNNNMFLAFERSSISPRADGTSAAAAVGGGDNASRPVPISPRQAALYLYTVSQTIVSLEAAVLGSRPPNSVYASAAGMDGMGPSNVMGGGRGGGGAVGGLSAKQVSEIVSAVSIAATYCNSRSIITQSGILPALSHLIESTGTVTPPPTAMLTSKKQQTAVLHALTPFHPEFLQVALLAGQYRYASSFLASHPTSHTTLQFPYLRLEPTSYLRTHYYAGLVYIGCDDWNAALDSFHLCLTVPCSTVSAVSVAARKKSLLVQCLLLESEELDGNASDSATKSNIQRIGGAGSGAGKSNKRSALESKVLDLPGAASQAVCKYMSASSNRVGGERVTSSGGSGSGPERTTGSETSEQQTSGRRRRMRSANSQSSSDAAGGERGGNERTGAGSNTAEGGAGSTSKSKNYSNLGSYHDLVVSYISGNSSHYAKLLAEMYNLLHNDGNWGLAKRLEGRLLAYRSIRRVASVYSVVGADVLERRVQDGNGDGISASEVSVGEVGKRGMEDVLMGMAMCDARDPLLIDPFVARIDQSTGMVSFLDKYDGDDNSDSDDEEYEQWMEEDLSNRLRSCISLAERVRDLDIGLTTSPKYQQHVMKEMMMKGDHRGSGGASGAMKQGPGGGASVADIGQGPMDIGVEW